jgi:DNA-binding HxlR family transcriptional regulator
MRKNAAKTEEHRQAEALRLLGDYTTLRIIDFLRSSELRFTELQRILGDTNSVTLTKRLKKLKGRGSSTAGRPRTSGRFSRTTSGERN